MLVLLGLLLIANSQYTATPTVIESEFVVTAGSSTNLPSTIDSNDYAYSYDAKDINSYNGGNARNINGRGYNHNRTEDEAMGEMMTVITFVVVAGCVIAAGLAGFMIWRCMKRRALTGQIKDHMRIRRQEFATNMGLNLFEMNNNFHTVHV